MGIKIVLRGQNGSPQSMVARCGPGREVLTIARFKEEIIPCPMTVLYPSKRLNSCVENDESPCLSHRELNLILTLWSFKPKHSCLKNTQLPHSLKNQLWFVFLNSQNYPLRAPISKQHALTSKKIRQQCLLKKQTELLIK